jgi:hypothetical protein
MDMLLGENVVADKETRMEVLTRMRDHAPAGFFEVIGKNTPMVGLMQSWAREHTKRRNWRMTLMPLLQVSLPVYEGTNETSGRKKIDLFLMVK